MAGRYSDERIEAAVRALSDRERFREAETLVAAAAPRLQGILAQALEEGGWFAESHDDELRKAASGPETERLAALRTLLAEETRVGMLVGVAVGWALRDELEQTNEEE